MASLVGQVLLDQFRVDAFIASGGMGAVYRVWDLKRNVPLAMKVLHADLADDPSIFRRFQREARALQHLAHPNIVPFYGLFHAGEIAFLLERFIDGPSLKDILRQRKGSFMPVDDALVYLKAVSSALGYAHAHGVVHCDVKPGNVMVDRGGGVYLTDFGVARHAESTTTTLGFAGTAGYMAPEQVRGDRVSPATDVYALGVMLYEMLTGEKPFRGDEPESEGQGTSQAERVRWAHVHLVPADPRVKNLALPQGLARVIMKALGKDPGTRFGGARELYEAACAAGNIRGHEILDHTAQLGSATPRTSIMSSATDARAYVAPPGASAAPARSCAWSAVAILGAMVIVILMAVSIAQSASRARTEGPKLSTPTLQSVVGGNGPTITPLVTVAQETALSIARPAKLQSHGVLEIPQSYTADLDRGVLATDSGEDIWFEAVSSTEKYIVPRNGAALSVWGANEPSLDDCSKEGLEYTRLPLRTMTTGVWACFRTNSGTYGRYRVERLTARGVQTLTIRIETWE